MATLAEVCGHISVTTKTLQEYLEKGIVTRQPPGKYDLDFVRAEYIKHIRAVASGRSRQGDLDLQAERARLAKEQADAKEMENAIERGELVYIDDVARQIENQLTKVRTKLLAIPTKAAPECQSVATVGEVRDIIEAAIIEALNELSGYNKDNPDQEAG